MGVRSSAGSVMRVYVVAGDGFGAADQWCAGCGEAFACMGVSWMRRAARLAHARIPKLYAGCVAGRKKYVNNALPSKLSFNLPPKRLAGSAPPIRAHPEDKNG